MTRAERIWYWFERRWWDLHEFGWRVYQNHWACKRGNHRLKFSGCMYCGAEDNRQVWFYVDLEEGWK